MEYKKSESGERQEQGVYKPYIPLAYIDRTQYANVYVDKDNPAKYSVELFQTGR